MTTDTAPTDTAAADPASAQSKTAADATADKHGMTMSKLVHGWHAHPSVRSQSELTRGERAADKMRNGMGSWGFVFAALAFLAVWMVFNALRGHAAFDAYPFILLNLVLSCLAAMQGAILLIAAKRSDQVVGRAGAARLRHRLPGREADRVAAQEPATSCETTTGTCTTSSLSLTAAEQGLTQKSPPVSSLTPAEICLGEGWALRGLEALGAGQLAQATERLDLELTDALAGQREP